MERKNGVKRSHYGVLFAVLLLALINLSPSQSMKNMGNEEEADEQIILPSDEQAKDEGKITVAVQMGQSEFVALQQMNEAFLKKHDFEVELINEEIGANYDKFQSQLELSEAPDVFLMDNEWVRSFASQGFLLPTDRYYSGSLNGEILRHVVAQNEWNGYTWGVPFDVDPYVIVYNVNALKRLGLASPPASQLEWTKLIEDFKAQDHIPYLLSYDYDDPYAALTLMWQLSENKFGENISLVLADELKSSIQHIESLRPKMLDSNGDSNDEIWKMCYDEKLLLYITKASEAIGRSDHVLGIVYPQQENKQRSVWMHGRSFVVPAQTNNAKKAGEWITAMTNDLDQSRWFQATSHLPVNKSQYMNKTLPSWIPTAMANTRSDLIPVYGKLPEQMIQYGKFTSQFMKNQINIKEYSQHIANLFNQ